MKINTNQLKKFKHNIKYNKILLMNKYDLSLYYHHVIAILKQLQIQALS